MANELEWIPIADAMGQIADAFYDHVAQSWPVAYWAAWQAVEGPLAEGLLPSRSSTPDSFQLTEGDGADPVHWTLFEDGFLPQHFWLGWREAKRNSGGLVWLGNGRGERPGASQSENDFSFFEDRIGMRGAVSGIEILRSAMPRGRAKRGRGRPRGKTYSNEELVAKAVQEIKSGLLKRREASGKFGPDMASEADPPNKVRMFRDLLFKQLGPERKSSNITPST